MNLQVLMVSRLFPPYSFGGAPVQAVRLSKALQATHCVDVGFLTDAFENKSSSDVFEGIKIFRRRTFFSSRASKIGELIFSLRTLLFVLLNKNWKILHFHSACGFEILFFPVYKLLGKNIVLKLTLAGSDDPLTYKNRRFLGWAYILGLRHVDMMIAISPKLKGMAIEAGIPSPRVELIPNGVDEETFHPATQAERLSLRDALKLNEDDFVCLCVGKIEHRKGYDILIQAFHKICETRPSAKLLVVGPGNEKSNEFYSNLVRNTSTLASSRVRYEGLRNNISDYMKASDAFLFCSREEGFGTVLIEAMSCGLPTVALNIEGITADILDDASISEICYSRSPQEFYASAMALFNRSTKLEHNKAALKVLKKYSISGTAASYLSTYRGITEKLKPRGFKAS